MRLSRYFFLMLNCTCLSVYSSAQSSKTDSLQKILLVALDDTQKVKTYIALSEQYISKNPQKSFDYAFKGLSLSQKLKWTRGLGISFHTLGNVRYAQSNYPEAINNWTSAIKIRKELDDKKGVAALLGNIGVVYKQQGDYPKALKYYFSALKMSEEMGDKNLMAHHLGNIGMIYWSQADYYSKDNSNRNTLLNKALNYYFKALKKSEEAGVKNLIALWLGNIGNVQYNLYHFPEAMEYYIRALKIDEESVNMQGVAIHLGNIAMIYNHNMNEAMATGDTTAVDSLNKLTLRYAFNALKIERELGVYSGIAIRLINIGSHYIDLGDFPKGEQYLKESASICDSIGILDISRRVEIRLSDLYDTLGQIEFSGKKIIGFNKMNSSDFYKLAYTHYKKYSTAKDSIFNEEKSKDIGRLEQKHEYEMEELKQQQEEREKRRQLAVALSRRNTLEYSGILMGIFVLFVIVFFMARFNLPHWAVEMAVFIPFLILFEFVLVLLDPYLEQMTRGEPVWKLLVNALLAAVIFPLHGFFEQLLKKRISKSKKNEMRGMSS